eukprot:5008841-Pleurochrysis_carterae.AAC.4
MHPKPLLPQPHQLHSSFHRQASRSFQKLPEAFTSVPQAYHRRTTSIPQAYQKLPEAHQKCAQASARFHTHRHRHIHIHRLTHARTHAHTHKHTRTYTSFHRPLDCAPSLPIWSCSRTLVPRVAATTGAAAASRSRACPWHTKRDQAEWVALAAHTTRMAPRGSHTLSLWKRTIANSKHSAKRRRSHVCCITS